MFDFLIATANAQTTQAPAQPAWVSFMPFVLIFLVMYFLMIRPQKKRMEQEQAFINKLSHGDEVYTKSGILGKITGISEKVVTLELEGGTKMKVLKSHIGGSAASLLSEPKK
ncbi:MAG: preprotein translocase subunit YajC [Bacteriovoracia bacterium]